MPRMRIAFILMVLGAAAALQAQQPTIRQYQLEKGAEGFQLALKTVKGGHQTDQSQLGGMQAVR